MLDDKRVAYLDLTGSGNETAAHLLADGRMTLMFCAFEGDHLILRLYGRGRAIKPGDPEWATLAPQFPTLPGTRQIILLDIESLQTSCGAGVPLYDIPGRTRGAAALAGKERRTGCARLPARKEPGQHRWPANWSLRGENIMKHIGLIVLLLATALLTACEEKPYKPPVPHTEPDKSATKLFEPQREALDKAKGVGKTLEQASQEQKEATEKAAGY